MKKDYIKLLEDLQRKLKGTDREPEIDDIAFQFYTDPEAAERRMDKLDPLLNSPLMKALK